MVDLSVLCYPNGTEVDYYSVCSIPNSVSEAPDETRDVAVGHRYWTMDQHSSLYGADCWHCWVHHWTHHRADLWVDLSVHFLSLQVKATWMVVVYCSIQLDEEDHCNDEKVSWYYEGKILHKQLEIQRDNSEYVLIATNLARSYHFFHDFASQPCI